RTARLLDGPTTQSQRRRRAPNRSRARHTCDRTDQPCEPDQGTAGDTRGLRFRTTTQRKTDAHAATARLGRAAAAAAKLTRELDRLEMVISQIAAVEAARDHALAVKQQTVALAATAAGSTPTADAGALRYRLRGIGSELASVLSLEAFYRSFG